MPPSALLAIAYLLFVSGLAMWRGRAPEKIVGLGAALNEGLYLIFYHPNENVNAQWEAMIIDALFAAVIGYVAIKWDRAWAKWACAFELLIVGTHIATALDLRIATFWEYWSAAFWTTAMLLALLIGTIQVIRDEWRLKRQTASSPEAYHRDGH